MFQDPSREKKYVKLALFGGPGEGKTRFALSFPKPAVIDGERGTDPYVGKYAFKLLRSNRWRQLEAPINWLKKNPGLYETLIIDPMTIFYMDLIQDIVDYIKNKRGNEIMTNGDWGVQKRRYAAFCNLLIELPMHIVLVFRQKPEYEDTINKLGEEVRKRTGSYLMHADEQTRYLFDLSIRCYTEIGKKKEGEPKFKAQVEKTRYNEWMPLYSTHDITGEFAFEKLFATHVGQMLDAPDAKPSPLPDEPFVIVDDAKKPATEEADPAKAQAARDKGSIEDKRTADDRLAEVLEKFGGKKPRGPGDKLVTDDDLKVLFTRAGDLTWPDKKVRCRRQSCSRPGHVHPEFSAEDGKEMLKAHWGIESSKEMLKDEFSFLYREMGKVLSGLAYLERGSNGVPFIATGEGISEQQIKASVENGGWA